MMDLMKKAQAKLAGLIVSGILLVAGIVVVALNLYGSSAIGGANSATVTSLIIYGIAMIVGSIALFVLFTS